MNVKLNRFKFEVFGKVMLIEKCDKGWLLFDCVNPGMRRPIFDVVIPDEIEADELAKFLADIFHESASDRYPEVVLLD